jgi:hypothetical protein
MQMKTLLATVALAAVVASPALAQYGTPHRQARHPYNVYAIPFAQPDGYRSYAQRRSVNPSFKVVNPRGDYLGADPDPTVRDQLLRDPTQGD